MNQNCVMLWELHFPSSAPTMTLFQGTVAPEVAINKELKGHTPYTAPQGRAWGPNLNSLSTENISGTGPKARITFLKLFWLFFSFFLRFNHIDCASSPRLHSVVAHIYKPSIGRLRQEDHM